MIVLLVLLLLPLVKTEPCLPQGEWTEWSQWTQCPSQMNSIMNFRARIRNCHQRPEGCVVMAAYSCPGTYSEVAYCEVSTSPPAAQPTASSPPNPPTTQPSPTPPIVIATTTPLLVTILSTTTGNAAEETTIPLEPETTALSTVEVTAEITSTAGQESTIWNDVTTTIADLSDSTEPMGTMPTESSTAVPQETTAAMDTSGATDRTDSTVEMSTETAESRPPQLEESTVAMDTTAGEMSEGTTDLVITENPVTDEMTEETSGMVTETPGSEEGTTDMAMTETRALTDGPEATTDMEITETPVITDAQEETTGELETTTALPTCNDCHELNVHLYDEDPYEDGASVLNRYTRDGCKYVQFFCRPFQMGDDRPVRTVFNNDASITNLPLNVEVSCKNGQWWYENDQEIDVTSLSCIYEPPPTTTAMTTWAPGDPNSPCMKCGHNLYVEPAHGKLEGSVYVEYRENDCLQADLFCRPTKPNHFVDIYEDGVSVGITGTSLNRTFSCNYDSQWVDMHSNVVANVSCVMEKG